MTIKWQQVQKSGQYWLLPDDHGFLRTVHEDPTFFEDLLLQESPLPDWQDLPINPYLTDTDYFWDDVDSWKSSKDFLQWIEQIADWDADNEQWKPKYEESH